MLIICSIISLIIANSMFSESYLSFWKMYVGGMTVSYWVNDGLMAIFFLLIGLELKRELYKGELSDFRNALLPIFAAFGGFALPALFISVLTPDCRPKKASEFRWQPTSHLL